MQNWIDYIKLSYNAEGNIHISAIGYRVWLRRLAYLQRCYAVVW